MFKSLRRVVSKRNFWNLMSGNTTVHVSSFFYHIDYFRGEFCWIRWSAQHLKLKNWGKIENGSPMRLWLSRFQWKNFSLTILTLLSMIHLKSFAQSAIESFLKQNNSCLVLVNASTWIHRKYPCFYISYGI